MAISRTQVAQPESARGLDYDTIVIGAGISGLYQLHRLREMGQSVRVFEAGTGVGGTWYWNRYPGCRFDSESYSYGYSFSEELLDEWDWTEHFAPQPETERYLNYVADKLDLRRDIELRSRVTAAIFDESGRAWEVTLEDGRRYRSRYLVTAVGPLSAPTLPRIAGIEDFQGEAYHTARWPKHAVSFVGKRVAVIGTGRRVCRRSPRSPRPPGTSPSSSAARTGARRCTTGPSRRRRWPRSAGAMRRSSSGAGRRRPASSTRLTCAARSR